MNNAPLPPTPPLPHSVRIGSTSFCNTQPVSFILGPCQIETYDHTLFMAERIADICSNLGLSFVFKASFDKANRSSITGQRGVGFEQGLKILEAVKSKIGCPVISDVHETQQCAAAAEVLDALQIPAFLCRQTDLLLAAANTQRPVMVKKGQFLAPRDMAQVASKLTSTGNHDVMLCERGTTFGYNTLVNDFRGLEIMAQTGYPVVFDATHSVQQPGLHSEFSGGERRFVPTLARAACAVGVAGVFIETHDNPDHAPSDGPNMIELCALKDLLQTLKAIDALCKDSITI